MSGGARRLIRWLACAGCGLGLAACAASQPSSLSVAVFWAAPHQPLLDPADAQPPSALILRWDPKGTSSDQAEAIAEGQCLAWNKDAAPQGAQSRHGSLVIQHYICVASDAGNSADDQQPS